MGAKNKDLTFWVWAKLKFHGMLENIECGIEWIFFLSVEKDRARE